MSFTITSGMFGSVTIACMFWAIVSLPQPLPDQLPSDPPAPSAKPSAPELRLPPSHVFDIAPRSPDEMGEALRSLEDEIRIVAYRHGWNPKWFKDYLEKMVKSTCGAELSTFSRAEQQVLMNVAAALIATQLSPQIQHGLGDHTWVEERRNELAAALPDLWELSPHIGDRLSQMLPSGEHWATDITDPAYEVVHIAARFDALNDLAPAPPQFSVTPESLCEPPASVPKPQAPAPTPQDNSPKRGPVRIAQRLATGAIAAHQPN